MNKSDLSQFADPGKLIWAWLTTTAIAAVVAGATLGLSLALLVLAGGALVAVIGLLWSSLHALTGEAGLTLDEALHMAAPSAEEEQKRAVLRALKDLDFERSVGKISEEDYAQLKASYREQAKQLIAALDLNVQPIEGEIDAVVRARLGGDTPKPGKKKKTRSKSAKGAEPQVSAETVVQATSPDSSPEHAIPATAGSSTCPSCQTHNDPDARFCKRCGTALEAS